MTGTKIECSIKSNEEDKKNEEEEHEDDDGVRGQSVVVAENSDNEEKGDSDIHHDPSARCCAWCYNPNYCLKCPACPRVFCSHACRRKDWDFSHSFWCGKAGEKGVDFDVTPIAGKGLGLVTKRAFERGEAILVERPILTTRNVAIKTNDGDDANVRRAAMALSPLDADLQAKVDANGVSLSNAFAGEHAAGLFVTFSRVNHDCLGNSEHYFDRHHGVEVLVANGTILPGSEITFPYVRNKDRNGELCWRGFQCTCPACQSLDLGSKVDRMVDLDNAIVQLGGSDVEEESDQAIQFGQDLLALYDELGASDMKYAKTMYDLFQIHIMRDETLPDAQAFIEKAYQHAKRFTGYDGHDIVQMYRDYAIDPKSHQNYRAHAVA